MNTIKRWAVSLLSLAIAIPALALTLAAPATATVALSENCTYEWNRSIPQSHQEYQYKREVKEYATEYEYQKQVMGNVEKKTYGGWTVTGTFPFEWYTPDNGWPDGPLTQWSFDDVAVLESGGHDSVSSEYTVGDYTYRKVSTFYQFVKNGVTRQVETGSRYEYTGWTSEVLGDPWVKYDERTVQDAPIVQGPVRSEQEPDRGIYPNVPWVKNGDTKVCVPPTVVVPTPPTVVDKCDSLKGDTPVCSAPVKVRAAVKSVDKCRTSGDSFAVRSAKGVVYKADGQVVREGVWLKTNGDRKIVVKAKAASKRFDLVGKDRWVLRFDDRRCATPPNDGGDAGLMRAVV